MRTSMNIPTTLLVEAKEISQSRTQTQAVIIALTEMIQRRKSRRLLKLRGSMSENYNYLPTRKKR